MRHTDGLQLIEDPVDHHVARQLAPGEHLRRGERIEHPRLVVLDAVAQRLDVAVLRRACLQRDGGRCGRSEAMLMQRSRVHYSCRYSSSYPYNYSCKYSCHHCVQQRLLLDSIGAPSLASSSM